MHDSSYIEGDWKINKVSNPGSIGPQIGDGNLVGSFTEGKLHIELNSNFVDINVRLVEDLVRNRYSGKWFYSSFVGLTNEGTFVAIRK